MGGNSIPTSSSIPLSTWSVVSQPPASSTSMTMERAMEIATGDRPDFLALDFSMKSKVPFKLNLPVIDPSGQAATSLPDSRPAFRDSTMLGEQERDEEVSGLSNVKRSGSGVDELSLAAGRRPRAFAMRLSRGSSIQCHKERQTQMQGQSAT